MEVDMDEETRQACARGSRAAPLIRTGSSWPRSLSARSGRRGRAAPWTRRPRRPRARLDPLPSVRGLSSSAPLTTADPKTLLGDDQLKELRSEGACGSCGTAVARTESKVSLFSMQPRDEIYRCAHVTCPSCVTALCSGCFEPSGCEVDCESDQANGCASVIHCSKVRAVLAFEVRPQVPPPC